MLNTKNKSLQYPTYPAYKDSGVEWIGVIPEGWEVERGNYTFKVINERSQKGEEELLTVSEHVGVRPRSQSNVNMFMAESYEGYKICNPGDLVINSLWAWSRGLGFSKYKGIVSTAYSVYRPDFNKAIDIYLNYLLRIQRYVDQYSIFSKGIWISRLQLSDWSFLRIPIMLPPLSEQQAIADFLDTKTAKIDLAIAQKQKLIALLKERKQIMIQQAVTQGLNPAVPMKDSGVEWIGKIPEHWEVKRLKNLGYIYSGLSDKKGDDFSKDLKKKFKSFIPFTNVCNNLIISANQFQYVYIKKHEKQNRVLRGDILFLMSSETLEDIAKNSMYDGIEEELYLNSFCKGFRITEMLIHPQYINLLYSSNVYRKYFALAGKGFTRINLKQEYIANSFAIIPPLPEQKEIATYIEIQSEKIDRAVALQQRQIERLKEYKSVLIDAAVTGKIKVN